MKIPPEKFESVLFINQILKFDFNSSVKVFNRGVLTISSPIFQDDYPVVLRMQ